MAIDETLDSGSGSAVQIQQPPRYPLRLLGFLVGTLIGLVGLSLADNGRIFPPTRMVAVESLSLAKVARRQLDGIGLRVPRAIARHPASAPKPVSQTRRYTISDKAWYIFLPPGDSRHDSPDPSAPFKRWAQGEAFDSAESCERNRNRMLQETNYAMRRETEPTRYDGYVYLLKAWTYADCVSAQDVRITEAR